MLPLTVHDAGESLHLLFNEHLGATVRVCHISKASGYRGMPAVDASTVPTTTAVVLLYIHRFPTDLTSCAFVGSRLNHICSIGSFRMWQNQSPGYGNAEATLLGLVRFTAGLHEMGTRPKCGGSGLTGPRGVCWVTLEQRPDARASIQWAGAKKWVHDVFPYGRY